MVADEPCLSCQMCQGWLKNKRPTEDASIRPQPRRCVPADGVAAPGVCPWNPHVSLLYLLALSPALETRHLTALWLHARLPSDQRLALARCQSGVKATRTRRQMLIGVIVQELPSGNPWVDEADIRR